MTNEQAVHEADNMAIFKLGGHAIVLPMEQAIAALMVFKNARMYEYSYHSGSEKTHHIGGELPSVGIEIMPSDVYAEGLINGARKRS